MTIQDRARNRPVVYFAHPLGGEIDENLARAERWFFWLTEHEPRCAFLCPWMANVHAFRRRFGSIDDKGHPFRERSMLDNIAIAQLSGVEGIVLCGPRITPGMQLELDTVVANGGWVSKLTALGGGVEPPSKHELEALYGEVFGGYYPETWSPLALGRERWSV
jgi:hypothetical protein